MTPTRQNARMASDGTRDSLLVDQLADEDPKAAL